MFNCKPPLTPQSGRIFQVQMSANTEAVIKKLPEGTCEWLLQKSIAELFRLSMRRTPFIFV